MKIVVAPDSFKENLTAAQVARAIEAGIKRALPKAQVRSVPMADGGDGTLEVLAQGRGQIVDGRVSGPLGDAVPARFGILKDRTAVIEMAQASGLALVPFERRNPMLTTTLGTGEQLREALDRGCKRIILTLGGVSTNEAGAGMAAALGFRLLDRAGKRIGPGVLGLQDLDRIDASGAHPALKDAKFIALCDVKNPLCGPNGSARVYGPQKGASPEQIPVIEKALKNFARIARRDLGKAVADVPGAGAAGGAGAGALAFLNAEFRSGIDFIMEELGLEKEIRGADWVVTAEGRIDEQTAFGKTPAGVARLAKRHRAPVVAFCAALGPGHEKALEAGIDSIVPIAPGPISHQDSLRRAPELLQSAAERTFRLIQAAGA